MTKIVLEWVADIQAELMKELQVSDGKCVAINVLSIVIEMPWLPL
jgi:hypothetical protein